MIGTERNIPEGNGSAAAADPDSRPSVTSPLSPEEAAIPTGAAPPATEADSEACLAEAEAEITRLKDEYLRALAETENVRRRAARDRQEASLYAISAFARDLLSVADNLRRALDSVDRQASTGDPALAALIAGVEMTERELLTVFERHGISRIGAAGRPFDPHRHEAMFEVSNPDVATGTVVQVLQEGYALHDRTLRPSRVGVAKGGPKAAPAPVESEAPLPETATEAEARASSAAYETQGRSGIGGGERIDEEL
jgi:molecular chaperone GrpE